MKGNIYLLFKIEKIILYTNLSCSVQFFILDFPMTPFLVCVKRDFFRYQNLWNFIFCGCLGNVLLCYRKLAFDLFPTYGKKGFWTYGKSVGLIFYISFVWTSNTYNNIWQNDLFYNVFSNHPINIDLEDVIKLSVYLNCTHLKVAQVLAYFYHHFSIILKAVKHIPSFNDIVYFTDLLISQNSN